MSCQRGMRRSVIAWPACGGRVLGSTRRRILGGGHCLWCPNPHLTARLDVRLDMLPVAGRL